jgi:hypothetical protein
MGGMITILHFFADYAIPIYLLLLIGILIATRKLIQARSEIRESLYGLEREIARRHTSQAIAALSLVVFMALSEVALTVFMAPNLPASSLLVTPTMNPIIKETITIPADILTTLGLSTTVNTPTARTTGCIPGQIMITSPKAGDVVMGQVILVGTANIPNFGFYKYEFSPIGVDAWLTIQANHAVRQDEELGQWDTSEVTPGDYNLRLVVRDNQGNALPPCVVPLRVIAS